MKVLLAVVSVANYALEGDLSVALPELFSGL